VGATEKLAKWSLSVRSALKRHKNVQLSMQMRLPHSHFFFPQLRQMAVAECSLTLTWNASGQGKMAGKTVRMTM